MPKNLDIGLFVGTLGLFVFATLSVCLRGLVTLSTNVELMGFWKQKKLSFEELGEILAIGLSVCPSVCHSWDDWNSRGAIAKAHFHSCFWRNKHQKFETTRLFFVMSFFFIDSTCIGQHTSSARYRYRYQYQVPGVWIIHYYVVSGVIEHPIPNAKVSGHGFYLHSCIYLNVWLHT